MESVFDAILPVFGILVIGYLAARLGFMEDSAVDGLSKFVFNFAVPLLLFRKVAQASQRIALGPTCSSLPRHCPVT